jgi:hypothetical protein
MNDTFSFKRLLMLVQKHWHENKKLHWLGLLASTGVLLAFYLFVIVTHSYRVLTIEDQALYFFISLVLVFIIYSLVFFNVLNKKEKATPYLLIPASHLEKLLCGIFYCTIVLSIVWFGVFSLVNTSMVGLFNKIASSNMEKYMDMFINKKFIPRETDTFFLFKDMYLNALSISFSLQAGALLGSFYFQKYTLVKTIATTVGVWLLLVVIQSIILQGTMPTKFYLFEMGVYKTSSWSMDAEGKDIYTPSKYIFLSGSLKAISTVLLYYAIWPMLTLATYFRLKEKEI